MFWVIELNNCSWELFFSRMRLPEPAILPKKDRLPGMENTKRKAVHVVFPRGKIVFDPHPNLIISKSNR